MCRFLETNKRIARIMINNNNDADFPEKIFSLPIMKKNADIYIKTRFGKKLNEKETRYIYMFFLFTEGTI